MSQELSVSLERHGALIDLDMAGAALGRVHIDNGALPEEERAGTAKKLLGASMLFNEWLTPFGIQVVWLSGRLKKSVKQARQAQAAGASHLLVGTHVLIQEEVILPDWAWRSLMNSTVLVWRSGSNYARKARIHISS